MAGPPVCVVVNVAVNVTLVPARTWVLEDAMEVVELLTTFTVNGAEVDAV